jgi:hypothetical protein
LGNFVQGLFKKNKSPQSLVGTKVEYGAGQIYLDGVPFGEIKSIEHIELDKHGNCKNIAWDSNEISFTIDDVDPSLIEELGKMLNTSRTTLPKLIKVPTLLISICDNWEFDSIGVDLSQLEEKGIAHYFCTSTESMEAWYRRIYDDEEECPYDDMETMCLKDAYLYEREDGLWTWSC